MLIDVYALFFITGNLAVKLFPEVIHIVDKICGYMDNFFEYNDTLVNSFRANDFVKHADNIRRIILKYGYFFRF